MSFSWRDRYARGVFLTRRRILFLGILTRRKTSKVSRPRLLVRQPIDSSKTRATTLLSSIFVLASSLSFCGSEYDDFSSSSGRRLGTHDWSEIDSGDEHSGKIAPSGEKNDRATLDYCKRSRPWDKLHRSGIGNLTVEKNYEMRGWFRVMFFFYSTQRWKLKKSSVAGADGRIVGREKERLGFATGFWTLINWADESRWLGGKSNLRNDSRRA